MWRRFWRFTGISTVLPIAPEEVQQQLSDGDPRIEMFTHDNGVEVMPYMMEQGEDVVVARRLREVLEGDRR